jgi:hypothetical protein
MSAIPPKADIAKHPWDVRFVPKADVRHSLNVDLPNAPPKAFLKGVNNTDTLWRYAVFERGRPFGKEGS